MRARRRAENYNVQAEQARYDQTIQSLKTQEAKARALIEAALSRAENTPVQLKAAQETELRAPELDTQRGEAEAKVRAAQSQRVEAQSKVSGIRAQRLEAEAKLAADESTYQMKAASATPGVVAGNDLEIAQRAVEAGRARAVGVYYTVRNLLIVPAGTIGGILWAHNPQAPLQVAGAVGMLGVAAFWITSKEMR